MPTPKEEVETLMNNLLSFARQMLAKHGEFYPYGGYIAMDGKVVHVGGQIEGTDHPKSQPIIDLLREDLRRKASNGELKAAAVIFDVRIKPPGEENKTDAIQVCLDHQSGYSAEVLFPYTFTNRELLFGKIFAQKGNAEIFAPK